MTAAIPELDAPVPATLPVGVASAISCRGRCRTGGRPLAGVTLRASGANHRAQWLPDGQFWATVPVPAAARPGTIALEALVRVAGGPEERLPLAEIEVVAPPAAAPASGTAAAGPETVFVCMATFDPDLALLRAQLESLRAQSDPAWVCLISDDCSSEHSFDGLLELVGDDRRFVVSRSERRLGFYRNFERALSLVPAQAELIALCDQDDRWHPDKLAVLRAALPGATLVYSDQRLVTAGGRLLRATLWHGRRNNHTNLASMLIANSITGAASLMRREVLDLALPFPEVAGYQFHDHWLGLVALSLGEIAYVDRPLYDYVQHAGAVFGDVTQGRPDGPAARRARGARRARRGARREARRAAYFYGYLPRQAQACAVLARGGACIAPRKRRALAGFIACDRSAFAFAWLLARSLRCLVGRNETLATELELAQGIAWRWFEAIRQRLAARAGRLGEPAPPPALDAFSQRRLRRWRATL
ncbi:MAG: glycosyltransferase [Solirubrobacterales bacterium]|nr:glycosyltransferase [Solirubrobacterales bacterium]MBV9714930.1 glycosyltransferase [Solirubrobacterales bacterium]